MSARALPFLPELRLTLADSLMDVWESDAKPGAPTPPLPYWGFPWPGGQALARYVLDHPALVRGKRVLDVGVGSGLVAIAAALAGAASVRATDVDPRAREAARANAAENGVRLDVELRDVLEDTIDVDVVLAGDLFYERALAARVLAFLSRHPVSLAGDAGRTYFVPERFDELARYEVPTSAAVEGRAIRPAGVYRLR